MPSQSLSATKVVLGIKEQAATIAFVLTFLLVQGFGVIIFSNNAQAVGSIAYNSKITSRSVGLPLSFDKDSAGNIYSVDFLNQKVRKYSSTGELLLEWGSLGTGDGQFAEGSPTRVAVDASDNVYIMDINNNRIQKFNSSGVYQSQFGSYGSGNGEFDFSYGRGGGIDADASGNVYVADAGNHRVQKFNSSGVYQSQFGSSGSGNGEFTYMNDIGIAPNGDIYVTEGSGGLGGSNRTQHLTSTGSWVASLAQSPTTLPMGIDFDSNGYVYIADGAQDRFYKYDMNNNDSFVSWIRNIRVTSFAFDVVANDDGTFYTSDSEFSYGGDRIIKKIDSSGTTLLKIADGQYGVLNDPAAVAVGTDGSIFVASRSAGKIQKYSSTGQIERMWGNTSGVGNDAISYPTSLAVDAGNNVYVVDMLGARVVKFDADGNYITRWGSSGSGDGQLYRPHGITVDPAGNVYVADLGNNRIQKFNSTGTFIAKWGSTGTSNTQFSDVSDVAADNFGNIYTVEENNARVKKYDKNGNFVMKWGTSGSGDGQFSKPNSITVDASGHVFVGDITLLRVQKFAADGTYIAKWGTSGTGDGQFKFTHTGSPTVYGAALASSGDKIYVADLGNNRVQVFNDGSSDLRITTKGTIYMAPDEAVVWAQTNDVGNVIADSYSFEYGPTTSYGSTVAPYDNRIDKVAASAIDPDSYSGALQMSTFGGIFDSQGNYYVPSVAGCKIVKFDSNGTFAYELGSTCAQNSTTSFSFFAGIMAVDFDDNLYVTDLNNSQYIKKFDSAGNYIGYIDAGSDVYNDGIHSMVVDGKGNLYVGTSHSPRVLVFDSSGNQTNVWNSAGSGDGQFNGLDADVTLDGQGYVYVRNGGRVQKFSAAGTYLSQWSISGSGQFVISKNNTVYAQNGNRIDIYTLNGDYLEGFNVPMSWMQPIVGTNDITGEVTINDGVNQGTFSKYGRSVFADITGLDCNATYHYRVKAVSGSDSVYGADSTFTTNDCFAITTTTLPDGVVGTVYNQPVIANRDNATFTLDSGSLPPGLNLDAAGAISGNPTTAGTYNFTVQAQDSGSGDIDTQALQIIVHEADVDYPFTITTTSLPSGTKGRAYSKALTTDSPTAVSFSLQSGTLPDGISLNSSGVFSGTPTQTGNFTITVLGDNGTNTATKEFTLAIGAAADQGVVTDPPPTDTPTDPVVDTPPEVPSDSLPEDTTFVPSTKPGKNSSIAAPALTALNQNNFLALAKRIPEPIAIGFPWLLLVLALILVTSQYYQVRSEALATRRMQASVDKQKQLVEEQNNFVALSTHYLHTPLTVMEGEIALMVKAGTMTEAQATKLKASIAALSSEADAMLAQEEHNELHA